MTDDDTLLPPQRFRLFAEAEPGLLPRLLEPFARRGVIPEHVAITRQGAALAVEIVIPPLPAGLLRPIEGNLGQIVGLMTLERAELAREELAREELARIAIAA